MTDEVEVAVAEPVAEEAVEPETVTAPEPTAEATYDPMDDDYDDE